MFFLKFVLLHITEISSKQFSLKKDQPSPSFLKKETGFNLFDNSETIIDKYDGFIHKLI